MKSYEHFIYMVQGILVSPKPCRFQISKIKARKSSIFDNINEIQIFLICH
jgi:hypothetical protein